MSVISEELMEKYSKPDFVYMFAPRPLGLVPSISPFALKLEGWLRMVDIPYEVVYSSKPSERTKQFPFVFLNGTEIYDSNLIIEQLSKHFNIPIDTHLSSEQKSVSLAFIRMIEEHTFQTYIWYRYVHNPDTFWKCFNFPSHGVDIEKRFKFVANVLKENVSKKSFHHGIGRKTPEEIFTMCENDLMSVSSYLGDNKFMMGDRLSLIDCVLFGHFVQLFYIPFDFPPSQFARESCQNLLRYTERVKDMLFQDWGKRCESSLNAA